MVNCCHINWPFWLVTFWCGLLQTLMEIWLEKMEIRHLWVQGLWSQNELQEEDHENIPISYVTAVPFELWYWSTGNYSPMDFDVLCSNSTHRQTAENNLIFKISITDSWIIPNPKENTHVAAFNGICPFHPSVLFCFPYCFCYVQQHPGKQAVLPRQNIQMVEIEGKMMPKQWLDNCIKIVVLPYDLRL